MTTVIVSTDRLWMVFHYHSSDVDHYLVRSDETPDEEDIVAHVLNEDFDAESGETLEVVEVDEIKTMPLEAPTLEIEDRWAIYSKAQAGFWSRVEGWVTYLEDATWYSEAEKAADEMMLEMDMGKVTDNEWAQVIL